MAEVLPNNDNLVNAPIQNELLPLESDLVTDPLLPPNTEGGDVGSRVDAATIGAFSPNGEQVPASDLAFIQQQIDPLSGQQLALGNVTQEDFTPGINLPLRVGGTSGQLTGSRDIFVSRAQAVPFALLERRRAAQQQAALKRSQDLGRFKLDKPALSKDPRFNRNLVETANKSTDIFIDRATKQFGSREAGLAALTSTSTKIGREFAQEMDNLEILAGEIDQIVDLNAEIDKAIQDGDQFVSDETLKLHQDFKNLTGDFTGGTASGAASFRDKLTQLQTSQSLDQFFKENDILKSIEGEIIQTAGVDDSRVDQFRTSTRFEKDFEKGARAQAKATKQNASFRNRQDLSEEDIFKRIMALKGKVDKRSVTVKAKPRARGGFSDDPDDINDRIRNIEILQKGFFNPDGTLGDTPNEEARKILRTLIGSKVPGKGSITDAVYVKGKDGGGDVIRLTVSSGQGGFLEQSIDIDLTDEGSFVELNGLLNGSPSEVLKIKNESFRGRSRRTNLPDKPVDVSEIKRNTKDGRIAIFNTKTKEFIRFE